VLEACGNAQTVMNDNSSRFGKYTEMHYSATVKIIGCTIKQVSSDRRLQSGRANPFPPPPQRPCACLFFLPAVPSGEDPHRLTARRRAQLPRLLRDAGRLAARAQTKTGPDPTAGLAPFAPRNCVAALPALTCNPFSPAPPLCRARTTSTSSRGECSGSRTKTMFRISSP
jgi:hypothetical protein